jgi:hypothetical protein
MKMSMTRIAAGLAFVLSFALDLSAQHQKPAEFSLYENETTSSGGGQDRPLPDMRLFQDATNNAIGLQCLRHSLISDLKKLGIPDLEQQLDALTKGNATVLREGSCSLTFPIIVGPQEDRLQPCCRRRYKIFPGLAAEAPPSALTICQQSLIGGANILQLVR